MSGRDSQRWTGSTRCRRVRPLLERYHDEALPVVQQALVARHVAECTDCRVEIEALRETRTALRGFVHAELAADPTAELWTRLAGRLALERPPALSARTRAADRVRELVQAYGRRALAVGTAAALLALALTIRPDAPQRLNVARDTFTVRAIDAGDHSVLVYETPDTGMTIIWVIEADTVAPPTGPTTS